MIKLVFTIFTSFLAFVCSHKKESHDLFMPNVTPVKDELSLCTAIKVSGESSYSIVGFLPSLEKGKAHRLMLYGCTEPGVTSIISDVVWDCGMNNKEIEPVYKPANICRSGLEVIYPAWPSDTQGIDLPREVGFLIGGASEIKYLVLQVHYENKLSAGETDNSGVTIYFNPKPLHNRAAVLVLGAHASGRSYSDTVYLETACRITEEKTIYPFAFLTHSQALGKEVSGYVVEQNPEGDIWYLLGSNNPQFSTSFGPVSYYLPITKGNILAARCVLSNTFHVFISVTKTDDICIFYLMYAVKDLSPLKQKSCISAGPPKYDWSTAKENFNRVPVKTMKKQFRRKYNLE